MFAKLEGKFLGRQTGTRVDQGRRAGDPDVLDGIIRSAPAARLGDQEGADARGRWDPDAGTCRRASGRENIFREES